MDATGRFDDLLDHLQRTTDLGRNQAARVVAEVLNYFSETAEGFVRRRHTELQRAGLLNADIYSTISAELAVRRVRPQPMNERQIRRTIYG